MFNVINSSLMENFTTFQAFSSTPENAKGQVSIFQGSRT